MVRRNLHQEITLPKNELTRYNEQIGIPSQNGLLFNYLINSFNLDMNEFLFIVKKENLSGSSLEKNLRNFLRFLNLKTLIIISIKEIQLIYFLKR